MMICNEGDVPDHGIWSRAGCEGDLTGYSSPSIIVEFVVAQTGASGFDCCGIPNAGSSKGDFLLPDFGKLLLSNVLIL